MLPNKFLMGRFLLDRMTIFVIYNVLDAKL